METAYRTDIGRIRVVNEDRVLVDNNLNGFTFAIVADGMGGHKAGDVASQMAIELIHQELQLLQAGMSAEECMDKMKTAVSKANESIYASAVNQEQYYGMGTTVVIVLVSAEGLIVAHIGDSRVYKWNGEHISQLTEDHSLVNELLKSGQISRDEANHHPRRNVLTRALGTEEVTDLEIQHLHWEPNDVLLLCSDGLSGFVDKDQMIEILRTNHNLEWKVNRLVDRALETGGDDNITVILLANDRYSWDEKEGNA
ncbi:MAG TPA: Stp1/IreP family PP2C-type Ser/Thr phosphatase [Bacilli bacterium]